MKFVQYVILSLTLLWSNQAWVCSSFLIEKGNQAVMGKSYDWHFGHGLLVVNKRNMAKMSLVLHPSDRPAQWVSKYGSVTFNQYAVEFPNGGINEEGLAIEILWLNQAKFPGMDSRETVNESQWIQYQLDNYADTAEVLAHLDDIRISKIYANVHYLVCDKTRHCAVIEYLNGKAVVSDNASAITNNTFDDSKTYRSQFAGFGGSKGLPQGTGSLDRFVRVSTFALNAHKSIQNAKEIAWDALKSVREFNQVSKYGSYWNIVYDFDDMNLEYRHEVQGKTYELDINKLDFSCKLPRLIFDLEARKRGQSMNQMLKKYTLKANQKIVAKSIGSIADHLPPGAQQVIEQLPSNYSCTE